MHAQEPTSDDFKKPSRRSWLRYAAGAVMLLFVLAGCTKDQLDMVKDPKTGGGVLGGTRDQWYQLKFRYNNIEKGQKDGRMGRILYAQQWTNYMEVDGGEEITLKLHPAGDGWSYWQTGEGNWVSLTATGWVYNYSDSTKKIAWKIVDGKLYNLYWSKDNWKDYPLGSQKRVSALVYNPVDGWHYEYAYFAAVEPGAGNVFTNCQLVPLP